ncbi:MAG: DUF86 domain-containing protein [Hyphomonadaceae bacterium]|nr:DUF86 domain-containing protein [Clostridia bacterium]
MNKRDRLIVLHILDTIEEIEAYLKQADCLTREDFKNNSMLKRAVTMCMISISEIVGNLSEEFQIANPAIHIKQFKQLRNIAAHNYGAISFSKLYDTVILELPILKEQLEIKLL